MDERKKEEKKSKTDFFFRLHSFQSKNIKGEMSWFSAALGREKALWELKITK